MDKVKRLLGQCGKSKNEMMMMTKKSYHDTLDDDKIYYDTGDDVCYPCYAGACTLPAESQA